MDSLRIKRIFSPGLGKPGQAINIRKSGGRNFYFDPHVNGYFNAKRGINCDFWNCPDSKQIRKLCRFQFQKGIISFYPTLITSSLDDFNQNLEKIQRYKKHHQQSELEAYHKKESYIKGVHIEGGLISKRGVHPEEYTKVFENLETVKALVEKYPGLIKMWTLCPTMDPSGEITKYLQSQGILVSYGHSNATYSQAKEAFEQHGVKTVTHWGNAMFLHKDISNARDITDEQIKMLLDPDSINNASNKDDFGIGYYALHDPKVTLQVISGRKRRNDQHLNPKLLAAVYKYKGPKKIALVSDVACNPMSTENLRGANSLLHKQHANLKRTLRKMKKHLTQ